MSCRLKWAVHLALTVCTLTLLAGHFAGRAAPTRLHSPLVGIDIGSPRAATLALPLDPAFEYGLLPLEGNVTIEGETFGQIGRAHV